MVLLLKDLGDDIAARLGLKRGGSEKIILSVLLAAIAFVALEILLFAYVDRPLARYAKELDQTSHGLIDFFRSITDFGKAGWYLWPCGLATLFAAFLVRGKDVPHRYQALSGYIGIRAVFLFSTVALSGIVANILKLFFGRARPLLWFQNNVYGFDFFKAFDFAWNSMPSGHTTTAFALAFSLSSLYPRGRFLWFFYALVLSASRILVDAHYLSDVLAGALLGCLTAWVVEKYGMSLLSRLFFPLTAPPSCSRKFP